MSNEVPTGGEMKFQVSESIEPASFRVPIHPDGLKVLDLGGGRTQAPSTDDVSKLKGRRVLVVEDSEDNRLLVKLLLARKGMSVDFAENGQIAVETAPSGNYDCVLMDMQMPVKDGYAATRELRQAGFKKPILALTAHAMKEDRARCLEAGCDDYLTKPIDSRALYTTLQRHLPVAVEAHVGSKD